MNPCYLLQHAFQSLYFIFVSSAFLKIAFLRCLRRITSLELNWKSYRFVACDYTESTGVGRMERLTDLRVVPLPLKTKFLVSLWQRFDIFLTTFWCFPLQLANHLIVTFWLASWSGSHQKVRKKMLKSLHGRFRTACVSHRRFFLQFHCASLRAARTDGM